MAFNTITGPRTYRIPPSEANALRRKAVRRNVIAGVVSFILPIAANEWRRSHKLPDLPSDISEVLLFTVFFVPMAALLVWVIWRNLEKARAGVDKLLSVEIIVDETSVSRRQPGVAEIRLPFAEIGRIEEYNRGLRIVARSIQREMWVPAGVERLEELETTIRGASGAELVSKSWWWNWGMLFVAGFIGSMITLMFAKDLVYLRAAALYALGFMVVGTFQLFRNPDMQARQKAKMAVGLVLLLSFVLARAIPLWPF